MASAALAGGHGDGNPAVKARQSHMTLYGHNLGVLGNMARGNIEYDAGAAQAAADNLVLLSQVSQRGYWAPETSNADLGDETRLLPALFEEGGFARAQEIGAQLSEAAVALAAVAGEGQAAIGPALGPVGQSCGTCHEAFRQPNN
ncbi:MAG: cytochrome c [Rhodobacteraceae bacterium]|jgi:cytochrome c556|nr:cytochrome c [Paracoccaceae bacterium]